jgi:hypothetical protein
MKEVTATMTQQPPGVPPAQRILQIASGGWMAQAMGAAAALGVADELACGPRSVAELAKATDTHPPSLYRLLRACADIGLLTEHGDRMFALTELGDAIRSDAPGSMRNLATWVGLPADRYTWAGLADSVRTGRPAFESAHGQPFFEYLRGHPDVLGVFDAAMSEVSAQLIPTLVAAYDFGRLGTVVDVGGGRGIMLAAVLAAYPGTRGVLYDWPDVIAGAGGPLDEAGVRDRCEIVSGDFFQSVPPGGDAYLLSGVVHAWDDGPASQVLAHCAAVMADGGRVLVVDEVLPEDGEPAPAAKLMDLNMLVLTGGRKRSEAEFAELFARAGLRLASVVPGGARSIVEGVRD